MKIDGCSPLIFINSSTILHDEQDATHVRHIWSDSKIMVLVIMCMAESGDLPALLKNLLPTMVHIPIQCFKILGLSCTMNL